MKTTRSARDVWENLKRDICWVLTVALIVAKLAHTLGFLPATPSHGPPAPSVQSSRSIL